MLFGAGVRGFLAYAEALERAAPGGGVVAVWAPEGDLLLDLAGEDALPLDAAVYAALVADEVIDAHGP